MCAFLPVVAIAVSSAAQASTYYVDGASSSCSNTGSGSSSQPYCTISAAMIARAGAGTTLLVKPAVYREQVTVSASGTASSPFVLQASGPGVIVDGSDDFGSTSLWSAFSGNVWVASSVTVAPIQVFADGARLLPAPAGTSPGQLASRTWMWVSGAGLYVNAGGGNPGTHATQVGKRSYGFRLDRRSWVTVTGFQVRHCEARDIYLTGPLDGALISDNVCTFAGKNGIAAISCSSVVIRRNLCSDHLDHGIYLQYTVASTVEDNESTRNARLEVRAANGINLNRSTGNVIQRNRLHRNQDTGLDFGTGANDNLSRQNLLYLNGDHGTDHVDCSGNVHIGDVAYRNYKDGFSFEGSAPNHKVFNCIGIENGLTVRPADGTLEFDLWIDQSSIPGFQSDYNIWWNSSTATTPIKYVATRYAKLADYVAASGQDIHSVQLNPMFADTAAADFRVLDGSPAIDAGTSSVTGWPSTDFDGRARWDDPVTANIGAGPVPYGERGAFEFFANATPLAVLTADVAFGGAPLAVTASGAASTDKDGKILTYQFDFGDGTVIGPQPAPTVSHVYGAVGEYTLLMTITDDREGVDTCAVPIVVVPNLAGNPGFETDMSGWVKVGSPTLSLVSGGYTGGSALQIKGGSSSSSTFGVDDIPNFVASTSGAGSRYRFGAWVRSASFKGKVTLEVREYVGASQKGSTTKSTAVTLSPTWQHLTVDYVVTTPGSMLDLHVVDVPTKSSETWLLDDVSIGLVSAPPPGPPPVPGNLVGNGTFETDIAGWTKLGSSTLSRIVGGLGGSYALQMVGSSTFGGDDLPNWITPVVDAGAKYRFAAWVRSASHHGKARISVLEYQGSTQQGSTVTSPEVALGPGWQQLVVEYTALRAGSTLSMRVTDTPSSGTETFVVDDVSIVLVSRPDRPPLVTAPAADSVLRRHPVSVTVTAADPDGQPIDSLTADLSMLPAGHDAVFTPSADHASGTLTWTPTAADIRSAPYMVTFTAANALSGSATTAIAVVDTVIPPPPPLSGNLVGNPGFETNATGWIANGSATLSRVSGGHSGTSALQIKGGSSSSAAFGADDSPNTVTLGDRAGSRYRFGAWVRSASFVGKVALEVREYQGATQVGATLTSSRVTLSTAWQYLTVDYLLTGTGTALDLRIVDLPTKSSEVWFLDDISIFLMSRPDRPPLVTAPAADSVLRRHPLSLTVTAADPDGQAIDSLSADLSMLPAGHDAVFTPSADASSGTFTWTPTAADIRSEPYVVTFNAGNAMIGSATTAIAVVDTVIPPPPPLSGNLVSNPGFESNTTGWVANGSATLSRVSGGHSGSSALQINGGSSSSASFGADDSPNSVTTSDLAGSRYRFGAWVRSASFVGKVALEVREYHGATQVGTTVASSQVMLSPTWQYVTVDHVVTGTGTALDLRIVDLPTRSSEVWFLDDVSVFLMSRLDRSPVVTAPAADSVMRGQPVSLTVTAADPEGQAIDSLTADLSMLPAGHDAVFTPSADQSSGTFTWTPTAADIRSEPYLVTFTAANAMIGSAATSITVVDTLIAPPPPPPPPDRAPVVTAPASVTVLRRQRVTVTVTAADPDSQAIDSLTVDLSALPAGNDAVFVPAADWTSGTLTWTPTAADIRATPYLVFFTAANALSGSDTTAIAVVDTVLSTPLPTNNNLVGNPGFETDLSGWGVYGTATLARVAGGHEGAYALQISGSGSFGCDDVPNWVTTVASAGAKYHVTAWVRSAAHVGKVKIRVYEYRGTTQQGVTVYSPEVPLTTGWLQLAADYTVLKAGSTLSIRVTDAPVASSEIFLVDDVSITHVNPPAPSLVAGPSLQQEANVMFEAVPVTFAAAFAPNPARGAGVLTFSLTHPGFARVDLFDASGRRVRRLLDRADLAPGRFRIPVDARDGRLASGVYFYRVEASEGVLRGRIAILR